MYYPLRLPKHAPVLHRREALASLVMLAVLLLNNLVAALPANPVHPQPGEAVGAPAAGSAAEVEPLPPAPAPWIPADVQGKPEVAALRTAHTATYDVGNGQYAQVLSQAPIHFQDADGSWQPVNPYFRREAGKWRNSTNTVRIEVDETFSAARVGAGATAVAWQPQALEFVEHDGTASTVASPRRFDDRQPAARSADGQVVRFAESWEGNLQDQWQSTPGRVEYTMRLAERPHRWFWQPTPASLDLRVKLTLREGTTLLVDDQPITASDLASPLATRHSLRFVGSDGEEMILHAPATYEQANPGTRVAGEYVLSATDRPDVVELRVRTPWQWLAADERQYPVIVDPIFQMRAPTEYWTALYSLSDLNTPSTVYNTNQLPDRIVVGRYPNTVWRGIVRFHIPHMPQGTVLDRAYLYAQPASFSLAADKASTPQNAFSMPVSVHAMTKDTWLGSGGVPEFNADPIDPDQQWVSARQSSDPAMGVRWDVTAQAQSWLVTAPNAPIVNYGLMIRSAVETCDPYLLPAIQVQNPFCGAVGFDTSPAAWNDIDLANTQASESESNPTFLPTTRGGLRLVVFYHSDNILTMGEIAGGDIPAPPSGNPYYAADHLYKVQPVDDSMWQAIVVRGLGERQGPPDPQGPGQIYRRPLQGQMKMTLSTVNDALALTTVTPAPGKVGYILLNGTGAAWNVFDQNTTLRVAGVNGQQPTGYDVRLHPQQTTISTVQSGNTPKVGPQKTGFTFDSANPLGLWNVAMPTGANSRVKIRIFSDSTRDNEYLKQYAREFSVKLVRSDQQGDLPLSDAISDVSFGKAVGDDGADESITFGPVQQNQNTGEATIETGIFPAQSGKWALALAYNGPEVTSWTIPYCGDENCAPPAQKVPIRYAVEVSVHSCPAGEFPTSDGNCQAVRCPTAAFPANIPGNYDEIGGVALWSEGGWNQAGGTAISSLGSGSPAPLMGPPRSLGVRQAPKVAIVGGIVTADKGANPPQISFTKSDVLLVNCGSPSGNVETFTYFQPYIGEMNFLGQTANGPGLVTKGAFSNLVDPWTQSDRSAGDITSEAPFLYPVQGNYAVSADVRRNTGMNSTVSLKFVAQYSVNANGWASLNRSVNLSQGGQLEKVASLAVGLGNSFTLDTPDAQQGASGVTTARRFAGIRAEQAFVVQDARMGGASKPVKAIILPRGIPIPSEPTSVACPASCVDLRAATDTFGVGNRVWEMPDVHTDVQPGTLAFSSEGAMTVWSKDHPSLVNGAGANGFAESFSFDAYKATVSVNNEPCENGGPSVLVIRGETRIAMPNIGSTADPNAGITAGFKLCEAPPDGVGLRSVVLSFESPVGIPIGASGMFLKALGGTVTIRPEGTRIEVDVTFQTEPTGPGGILRSTGKVIVDTQGLFAFKGEARLLGVFTANGSLWVAWNPLDIGFEITGGYEEWLYGTVRAHMWKGRGWNNYEWLPDNGAMHFTAAIEATIQIPEGALVDWGPVVVPPTDIGFSVALEFGEFCTNSSCTTFEWGIKGSFTVLGYEVGLYYGFDEGLDFILGNDDHILIDQYGGAQSSPVAGAVADANDAVRVQAAPAAANGVAIIPFNVSPNAENFLVALGWQAGNPSLSLINPDGVEVTAQNAAAAQGEVYTDASSTIFGIKAPKPGAWLARITNLTPQGFEHYKFVYLANKGQPGTAGNRGALLLPAVQNEQPANGLYNITWSVPADTTEQATIALYYKRTEVITGNLQADVPIVRNLPARTGSYTWDTGRMLAGTYEIKAVIDDGINELPEGKVTIPDDSCVAVTSGLPRMRAFAPNRFPGTVKLAAPGTVQIVDNAAPDSPTGLAVAAVDGAIMVRWNPSAARDVYAYQVQWGPFSPVNPLGFEPKNQALVTVGGELIYRIGAVFNGNQYGLNVSALDINGNASAPTAAAYATPVMGSNPVPLAPVNLSPAGRTAESASFVWQPGAGPAPAGYRLYYSKLGPVVETAAQEVGSTTSATIGGLALGATYKVTVAALSSDGWQSAQSNDVYVVVTSGDDANGDDVPDDWAAHYGAGDKNGDNDGDGLSNGDEYFRYTNPALQDSDGDGLSDAEEVVAGTDPLDDASYGSPMQPRLQLARERLRFQVKQQPGGEAAPQAVKWFNVGGGTLTLAAGSDSAWLLPSVAGDQVQVAVNAAGLTPGFYSGIVRLNAAPGTGALIGDPSCIRVNTWVLPADNDVSVEQPQVPATYIFMPVISR